MVKLKAKLAVIFEKSKSLCSMLSQQRHWTKIGDSSTITFDPRFLVFEFMSPFGLRVRQYELSKELARSAMNGVSTCQQMIMGSGKTTVIGPMVALLLADGRSLVTQVVPDQLLDMSQNVMRNAFGSCVIKEVFSLTFTRNGPTDNWKGIAGLLRKLRRARVKPQPCAIGRMLRWPLTCGRGLREYASTRVPRYAHTADPLCFTIVLLLHLVVPISFFRLLTTPIH